MAATNLIPIYNVCDLLGIEQYLGDKKHSNHSTHDIEGPFGSAFSAAEFAEKVGNAMRLLNSERQPQNQILIIGYWAIWRFEDQSNLSKDERLVFQTNALKCFSDGAPTRSYWHINWLLETPDFNLLIPAYFGSNLPILRRFRERSFYADCRDFADDQVVVLNAQRKSTSTLPLQTGSEAHIEALLTARWETVERKVATHAAKTGERVTLQNLPQILISMGFEEGEDWVIEGDVYIRFCRRKKGHVKWFHIRTKDFLETVERETAAVTIRNQRSISKQNQPEECAKNIGIRSAGISTLNQLTRCNTKEKNHEI